MISPVMLPARRTDPAHDIALQTALDRLTDGVAERPDTPDGWVTAVRRLPARAADYAPFPDGVDPRLQEMLRDRGIEQLYTHQAAAIAHALAGRNVVITTPTASGKTLCYNAPVLSAILRDSVDARAVSVSDQGAGAGSAGGAARAVRPALAHATEQSRSACSPTTATRRRMPGGRSAAARTSC